MGADGSQSGLAFKEETVPGTAATGKYTAINFVSEDLSYDKEQKTSESIRPDRQTLDLVPVSASIGGGPKTEFQADNIDFLIPGFLWAATDWTAPITLTQSISFAIEASAGIGGTITFGAGDAPLALVVGQFIWLNGQSDPANIGPLRIKSIVDQVVQVYSPLATEAGVTATLGGKFASNGVLKRYFSGERSNFDIGEHFLYTGLVPGKLSFDVNFGEFIKVDLSFSGMDEVQSTAQKSSPTPDSPTTNPVLTAGASVAAVYLDDTKVTSCLVKQIVFSIDNQTVGRGAIGSLAPCDVRGKAIKVEGKFTMYFNDGIEYAKYKNSTAFSVSVSVFDSDGKEMAVHLARCKYNKATANVTGMEDEVLLEADFVGLVGADGWTIGISKNY